MKSWTIAAVLLGFCGLIGCVQSVQPFVKESQATYEPGIVGIWSDGQGATADIQGDTAAKSYKATFTDKDGKVGHFNLRLGAIDGQMIVDVAPAELDLDKVSDVYMIHLLPLHSFLLLDRDGTEFKLRSMNDGWLGAELKDHPDALAHVTQGEDRIVLTASTDELQKFIVANIKTPKAFGEPNELKRVNPSTPPASSIPVKP